MIFIRHNRLEEPYNDYSKLSTKQLDDLATCEISPNIVELPEDINFDDNTMNSLEESRLFICSSQLRTKQTCEAIINKYNLNDKEIVTDEVLDEIFFIPSKLIKTVNENPLQAVRNYLYSSIIENTGATEDISNLEKRIKDIFKKYKNTNCVIFSHGFLIRLLISMQNHGGDIIKAINNISETQPINYLEANEISL